MARFASDGMIDGGLDKIATCTRMTICSAEPGTIADLTTYGLAEAAGLTSGDFTKANGDTSGRKITVAAQNALSITAPGTNEANHIALDDGTDLIVTTCTAQDLIGGGTVNVPAYDFEISAPGIPL
ncbi:MAG: hypothetical protein AAF434_17290 [Pseudomonadota bacterium]